MKFSTKSVLSGRWAVLSTGVSFGVIGSTLTWGAEPPQDPADFVLPEVVVDGSATEALQYDWITNPRSVRSSSTSGSGSLHREFQEKLPLPVTDSGAAGGFSQFRGLGRTVDETNVQTLGIPLNGPQGGGFDFSSFPQFLWNSYRFELGPQQGAYDARASVGTLALEPWTAAALERGQPSVRFSQLYSSQLFQTAVGASTRDFAALLGYSGNFSKGLSGSLSARLPLVKESARTRLHLLFTDLDSKSLYGGLTPNAMSAQTRWIPVLETSFGLGSARAGQLKFTAFFDDQKIRYRDPDSAFSSNDHAQQVGLETAWVSGPARAGLSIRKVDYQTSLGQTVPSETYGHASVSRVWDWNGLLLEPALQLDAWTARVLAPGGSLGLRYETQKAGDFFGRLGFTPRFPSLTDRYYVFPAGGGFPGFTGNPDLQPEDTLTALLGHEWKRKSLGGKLQLLGQFKDGVQLASVSPSDLNMNTVLNLGSARVISMLYDFNWAIFPYLDFVTSVAYSHSRVERTGQPFPYLPGMTKTFALEAHDADRTDWSVSSVFRAVSDHTADSLGTPNPGYGLLNLEARKRIFSGIEVLARVENILDRRVQVTRGFSLPGRIASAQLMARF